MAALSDRTTVPLPWLLAAIGVAFVIGGTATLGLARANDATERLAKTEQQIHLLDKRAQGVEDAVIVLKELLVELRQQRKAGR